MRKDKRRRQARVILVVIIVVAVVVCYVLPLATMGVAATEEPPATGEEEFGTDDPSILPPEITAPAEPPPPPPTIEIVNPPIIMDVGDRAVLQCVMTNFPEDVFPDWSSGNSNILAIDSSGQVEAISPGDAEVIVTAGNLRTSALVHVNELRANKISLIVRDIESEPTPSGRLAYRIQTTDVIRMSYSIEPKGANVDSISWSINDPEIAELANNGELIAQSVGEVSVTVTAGGLSDTVYFIIEERGVPVDTLIKYIIYVVIAIVVVVVIIAIIVNAVKKRKEEERKRAVIARQRKEEARQRAEEARKRAADEAEMAALVERNKQVLDMETTAHRSAKVSGATVSAIGDANKQNDDGEERPLTLDDIK